MFCDLCRRKTRANKNRKTVFRGIEDNHWRPYGTPALFVIRYWLLGETEYFSAAKVENGLCGNTEKTNEFPNNY